MNNFGCNKSLIEFQLSFKEHEQDKGGASPKKQETVFRSQTHLAFER